jgi:hypothetical protein
VTHCKCPPEFCECWAPEPEPGDLLVPLTDSTAEMLARRSNLPIDTVQGMMGVLERSFRQMYEPVKRLAEVFEEALEAKSEKAANMRRWDHPHASLRLPDLPPLPAPVIAPHARYAHRGPR